MADASSETTVTTNEAEPEPVIDLSESGTDTATDTADEPMDPAKTETKASETKAEDSPATKKKKKKKEPLVGPCRNCRTEGANLRCSKCKVVVYCNRNCQREDWRFHKRTCKPKEAKKPKSEAPKKTRPKKKKEEEVEVIDDEEILKDLKGYRYFSRQLSREETDLIGNITPRKLEPAAATDEAAAGGASAWNSSGTTYEEVDKTGWLTDRLKQLLPPVVYVQDPAAALTAALSAVTAATGGAAGEGKEDAAAAALAGMGTEALSSALAAASAAAGGGGEETYYCVAEVEEVSKAEGEAHIAVARGKRRFILDLQLEVKWKVTATRSGTQKSKVIKGELKFPEVSNDTEGAYETEFKFKKKAPSSAALANAVRQAVNGSDGGSLRLSICEAIQTALTEYKAM